MLVFEVTGNVPLIESLFVKPSSFLKEVFERLNRKGVRFNVLHSDTPPFTKGSRITRANMLLAPNQEKYLQVGKERIPVRLSILRDEKGNEVLTLVVDDYDSRLKL